MASTVRCPICGKPVAPSDPNMPFCGDRCRLLDLGNWASDKYVVSRPARQEEIDELEESDLPDSPGPR